MGGWVGGGGARPSLSFSFWSLSVDRVPQERAAAPQVGGARLPGGGHMARRAVQRLAVLCLLDGALACFAALPFLRVPGTSFTRYL